MEKKMGRPTKGEKPKTVSVHLRITDEEAELIQRVADKMGVSRTDAIIRCMQQVDAQSQK